MLEPEGVFLGLSILVEARNELFARLLLVGLLQDLSGVVACLDPLEPLKKFLVFLRYLVQSSKSLLVVQRGDHFVGLVKVGHF